MRKTIVALLILGAVIYAAHLRRVGQPWTSPQEAADVAPDEVGDETPEADPGAPVDAPPPPLEQYAAQCFRELRARNPIGRVLKFNANQLADRCSIIVETDAASGRWLFDWRDGDNGWQHEGEVRWPEAWPASVPADGIVAEAIAPERIAAMLETARARWPQADRGDWLYEIVWLPEPFARTLVFITFDDRRAEAGPHDGLGVIYDDTRALEGDAAAQADALYPLTRFELREDHNFKGALYESTALAESAISLEGDAARDPADALAASAERCIYWLHEVNAGSRVLRMALDAGHCWLLQENAHARGDFYLFSARDTEHFQESASLALEPPPRANLLLDRSRLSAARVRERLAQARARAGFVVERLAVAWVGGAMLWQFDGRADGRRTQVWLAEDGNEARPPARFPLSAQELDAGFPATSPVLAVAAESVLQ